MNTRILELANEADAVIRGFSNKPVNHAELEKFAELIMRECIELNRQELSFNAFEIMLNKYTDHFGVEE